MSRSETPAAGGAVLARRPSVPLSAPAPSLQPGDGGVRLFLGLCWSFMALAALWFVWQNGIQVPYLDEYPAFIPVFAGEERLSLGWLWKPYNDNRMPFAKLLNILLPWLTGYRWNACALLGVLVLGAVSLGLIVVASKTRGRPSPVDAIFPLILLNWGHWENIAWSAQHHFVWVHTILLALLMLIAGRRRYDSLAVIVLAGGGIALFPLLGPGALAYMPAMLLWLAYVTIAVWRQGSPGSGSKAALAGALALAGLVFLGLYSRGYQPVDAGEAGGMRIVLSSFVQAVSMTLGSDQVSYFRLQQEWPPLWVIAGTGLVLFHLATAGLLIAAWLRLPQERARAAGLLCYLAGTACVLLALAVQRRGSFEIATQSRYALVAMPPLFCGWYAWLLYGPRAITSLLLTGLFAAACLVLPLNMEYAWGETAKLAETHQAFVEALHSGRPAFVVADNHYPFVHAATGMAEVDEVIQADGKVRLVLKEFPILGPTSRTAAMASALPWTKSCQTPAGPAAWMLASFLVSLNLARTPSRA